jgi:hypothetical protein
VPAAKVHSDLPDDPDYRYEVMAPAVGPVTYTTDEEPSERPLHESVCPLTGTTTTVSCESS